MLAIQSKIKRAIWTLGMSSVFAMTGCATVATVAGYDTQTLNASAAKNYSEMKAQAQQSRTIDTQSATARRVQTIFRRMKPFAEQANQTGHQFNWEMTVIKSNELNAWAMPGGKMVVYTGIVNKLNLNDDEIAAIIGHEMTHALHEHSKSQYGQQILTDVAARYGKRVLQQQTGLSSDAIDKGVDFVKEYGVSMPFSRSQESDADAGGLRIMSQAGYNPSAAITLWQKMNQANSGSQSSFFSTHPSNSERIAAIEKLLPEMMPIYEQARKASGNTRRR